MLLVIDRDIWPFHANGSLCHASVEKARWIAMKWLPFAPARIRASTRDAADLYAIIFRRGSHPLSGSAGAPIANGQSPFPNGA
jgi:hypothetical protein